MQQLPTRKGRETGPNLNTCNLIIELIEYEIDIWLLLGAARTQTMFVWVHATTRRLLRSPRLANVLISERNGHIITIIWCFVCGTGINDPVLAAGVVASAHGVGCVMALPSIDAHCVIMVTTHEAGQRLVHIIEHSTNGTHQLC